MTEATSKPPTIECRPNGPYLVKNLPRLFNSKGEALEAKPVYALCRCGHSANKPFCDGTHAKVGFSSAREREDAGAEVDAYSGAQGTLTDNRGICAHAGFCTEGWPQVFRQGQEPWIDPDGADAHAVRAAVRKCPSGALAWIAVDETGQIPPEPPRIIVLKDGPYSVSGDVEPIDTETGQKPYNPAYYTLCRCGASKNKPFCDGSHWDAGFQDDRN